MEPQVAVFTTYHVLDGEPIMHVYHDEDGDWQFLANVETRVPDGRAVCLPDMLALDASLKDLLDLPEGWYAYRDTPDGSWVRAVYDS